MVDEIVGYKWLAKLENGTLISPWAWHCCDYIPHEKTVWTDGHIEAHEMPNANSDSENLPGIHACKNKDYTFIHYYPINVRYEWNYTFIFVSVLLSGTVIEGELGYRAQYANIVKIIYETPVIGYGLENLIQGLVFSNFIEGELKWILERS